MSEYRLPDRLTSYWNTLKRGDDMPDFTHFNASAVADIWQQCILFTVLPSVEGKPCTLNFYQMGEKVRELYGQDMVGRSFTPGQRMFQGAAVVRNIETLLQNPGALTDIGQFVNQKNKVVKYRSCMLPFGREGKVSHIVVGLSWREF